MKSLPSYRIFRAFMCFYLLLYFFLKFALVSNLLPKSQIIHFFLVLMSFWKVKIVSQFIPGFSDMRNVQVFLEPELRKM